jgi:drug/metabolite transporter (DMT)-like permease
MDGLEGEATPASFTRRLPSGMALNWLVLLVLVMIWGSTFAGIHIGVETIDPAWLVAGRLTCSSLFLGLFMMVGRAVNRRPRGDARPKIPAKAIWIFTLIGVAFTALPFFLYATAAETTGTAVMAICNGGTPFATAILAHYLVGDRLSSRRVIGVMLGFAGLVVLVLPEWSKGSQGSLFGVTLAIIGAMLYAGSNVGTRMSPTISPMASSFIISFSGAVAAVAGAALMAPFPMNPSNASLIAMVLLGLLPTAFALLLYVWLIQRAGAMFVAFTTYLSPLWATVVGVVVFNEPLEWSMLGALALILFGVAVANRSRLIPARPAAPVPRVD